MITQNENVDVIYLWVDKVSLSMYFLQILVLRLLQTILPSWELPQDETYMCSLVDRLFHSLGEVLLSCADDPVLSNSGETVTFMFCFM